MNSPTNPNHNLANYLIAQRNKCLDNYVALLHTQRNDFNNEDALTTRIRGGGMLDALIHYLQSNQMDKLLEYFQASSRQLLAANCTFEQIKLVYNLLEQTVLEIIPSEETNFELSVHFLKSAMQIARMIAVNQYVVHVSNRPSPAVPGSNGFSPAATQIQSPRPSTAYNQLPPAPKPQFQPEPVSERAKPARNSRFNGTSLAYMEWPLKALPNTRPPEYSAFLEDGSWTQVLLVDSLQAYTIQGLHSNGRISCQVRKVGPLALAYPI